jgi:hypothetical protein
MFSFGNRRRRSGFSGGLFRGGLLSSLLIAAAPFLYRKFVQQKNAGRFGLREAYPAGNSEW